MGRSVVESVSLDEFEILCATDADLRSKYEAVKQLEQSLQERDDDPISTSSVKNAAREHIAGFWAILRALHEAITADEPTAQSVVDAGASLVDRLVSGRQEMASVEAASSAPDLQVISRELQTAMDALRAYALAQYGWNLPGEIADFTGVHNNCSRVARCSVLGTVLQNGSLRYHSLSTPAADRSPSANALLVGIRHELQWALHNSIPGASEVTAMLLTQLPGLLDWVVAETARPVFSIPLKSADATQCFADVLRDACLAYGQRPLFGKPECDGSARSAVPAELRVDGGGCVRWQSYSEVLTQADRIARGITRMVSSRTNDLAGTSCIGPNVCILSENRPEWFAADMAAVFARKTSVGFHADLWGVEDVLQSLADFQVWRATYNIDTWHAARSGIPRAPCNSAMQSLANAQVGVLFASATHLRTAICAALAHDADVIVVCLDEEGVPVDDTQTVGCLIYETVLWHHECTSLPLCICTLPELEAIGHASTSALETAAAESSADGGELVYSLMLTSGSSGPSKAVPISHASFISQLTVHSNPSVLLSCVPSSLLPDRLAVYSVVMSGGRAAFARTQPSEISAPSAQDSAPSAPGLGHISELLLAVRPTDFRAPPFFFQKLFSACEAEVKAAAGGAAHAPDVVARYTKMLGGRCSSVHAGYAPLSPAVRHWVASTFGCTVSTDYWCTEVGSISSAGRLHPKFRQSGQSNFKLIDVPSLGYASSDVPYPRGEACVRTASKGSYYGDSAPSQAWDSDEYFHTGDIVELQPSGELRVIARRQDHIQLSTGSFVAAIDLETVFAECPHVLGVFVHASASKVVAVVIPTDDALARGREIPGIENPCVPANLLRERLRTDISCQIKAAGLRHALPQAALPVDVFVDVDADEWSLENGMLLPSGALNRTALEVQYHDELHSMLFDAPKELVAQPSAAVSFLRDALLSLIGDMVRAGSAEGSQDAPGMCQSSILDHSFAELGLDSLQFARFKAQLTAVSSVSKSLDIAVLLHTPLSELAAICNGDVSANVTKAWQLAQSERVAALIDQDSLLPTFRILETHDASSARDVLMTGATGFLGAHFLIELLRTTRGQPWKVHCLVRCIDAADGLQQLRHSRYQLKLDEVDAARIVIVCGDLSKPRFGLSERPWADLCTMIQSVIHLAERAQFSDDYSAARENVVGTLAVLQLCASSTPRKVLHHASTLSIFREDDRSSCCVIDETTPIGATARASGVLNASGYVQSKWVCEKLVTRASLDSNWQVPSFVYRLGCVSFNSNNGVDNQNGWFHKLLVGCVQALAVPPLEDGDSGSTSNLAPVDRAAKAMVDLFMLHQGARVPEGHCPSSVRHILNCAGSTPFGAFIRALEMRGLRFERMSTHADWLDAICRSGETNFFFRLKPWFERSMPGGKNDVIYQATQTMQQLATHTDWNRHWNGWSPIADDAIERHLDWLTCIGVLAA